MATSTPIKAVYELQQLTSKGGCKFLSFLYTRRDKETAKYLVNFGVSYRNAVEHDLAALESYTPANALEEEAKAEMLKSLTETVEEGVSSSYTQQDTYDHLWDGMKAHRETGDLYLWAFIQSKDVVEHCPNPKAPTKSNAKTLAKKAIEKACGFKRIKFRQFVLSPDQIGGILVNGDIIEIHP